MKHLPKATIKNYIKFLNTYKGLMGFSEFEICLATTAKEQDNLAEVETNIFEKQIKIALSLDFLKKNQKEKRNILFHELTHARICYAKLKIEEHTNIEEEHMVNDIVRGFEKLTHNFTK